ncbi:MAG: thymidine phosphorylase [Chloroflexi bacterium]|nr:thymidine phosphorylase [Chloroflexota bacterium]
MSYRAVDLIAQKRDGHRHSDEAIRWLIGAYLRDEVPDYQMAAWLMAVCWRGLDDGETRALTLVLAGSGRRLSFRGFGFPVVDKHSTGGVGDKTTLVLAPMLAAAGIGVAKMSGRGLGHTGGTIDKLESIPGVVTSTDPDALVAAVAQRRIAIAAQSPALAPGDGRLYALRDVTATVESIPLIASSVMSKKIATGANAVVLDVKVGAGAFMKDLPAARQLARAMVRLGQSVALPTVAVLTRMDEPLGRAIGNVLEVKEAAETLRGRGPDDLLEVCLALGSEVMVTAGAERSRPTARRLLARTVEDGTAFVHLLDLVASMGGDARCLADTGRLPQAPHVVDVPSPQDGFVAAVDALACGQAAMRLGAGRATKQDTIDPAVGIALRAKVGDHVSRGQPLFTIHAGAGKPSGPYTARPEPVEGRPSTGSGRAEKNPARLRAPIHARRPVPVDSSEHTGAGGADQAPASTTGDRDDQHERPVVEQVLAAFRWSETPVSRPPLVLATIR